MRKINNNIIPKLGLGCAPLGNLYNDITHKLALDILETAYFKYNINYFDTAPYYGYGLSESRIGDFIELYNPENLIISTKVGKILIENNKIDNKIRNKYGKPHDFVDFINTPKYSAFFDYSESGIKQSYLASCERLKTNNVNILFIHDLDKKVHGSEKFYYYLDQLLNYGGLDYLNYLKQNNYINNIGLGINDINSCNEILAKKSTFDLILLAGHYTILENNHNKLNYDIPIIFGSPYNSGILAQSLNDLEKNKNIYFEYQTANKNSINKTIKLHKLAEKYNTDLKTLALNFPFVKNNNIISVIPGAQDLTQVNENYQAFYNADSLATHWSNILADLAALEDL